MRLVGVDLAWGERNGDGVCALEDGAEGAQILEVGYVKGDDELVQFIEKQVAKRPAFVTIDAPIVCRNLTGTRPVDRLTHRLFHRQHAACHPANLGKCPRPTRLAQRLIDLGYKIGWAQPKVRQRWVSEVYPHPAMVRFFKLDRIIKYKKGPISNKRTEFARYQQLLGDFLTREFPELRQQPLLAPLLIAPWSKPVEDRLDGFFCALLALWHVRHQGARTEIIGDADTGFILLPVLSDS